MQPEEQAAQPTVLRQETERASSKHSSEVQAANTPVVRPNSQLAPLCKFPTWTSITRWWVALSSLLPVATGGSRPAAATMGHGWRSAPRARRAASPLLRSNGLLSRVQQLKQARAHIIALLDLSLLGFAARNGDSVSSVSVVLELTSQYQAHHTDDICPFFCFFPFSPLHPLLYGARTECCDSEVPGSLGRAPTSVDLGTARVPCLALLARPCWSGSG